MRKRYRYLGWGVLTLIILLIVARAFLPYMVKRYLNGRMDRMGDYHGHLADVQIHLWRGAYSINELRIDKVSGKLPVPLLDVKRTDITLSWPALRHGVLRGKLVFTEPTLNFVDGKSEGEKQAGKGVDWRSELKILTPFQLEELTVHNGTVTFQNFVSSPRVDLKMTELNGSVSNLTNVERRQGQRVAELHVTANVLHDAPLETRATFNPVQQGGDFSFQLQLRRIQLVRVNDLARAYSGLDFASGNGDFTIQLEAKNGRLDGYAKPLFHNLQLFSWKQDVQQEKKNPLKLAYEAVAQGVVSVFKNHEKDQFATRIPISGRIDDKRLDTMQSIYGVLHNAFVKAYSPQLENLQPRPSEDSH